MCNNAFESVLKERNMMQQKWFGMSRKERDKEYGKMVKRGVRCKRISLPNQDTWEPGMASFGVPMTSRKGYRHGTVYGILIY